MLTFSLPFFCGLQKLESTNKSKVNLIVWPSLSWVDLFSWIRNCRTYGTTWEQLRLTLVTKRVFELLFSRRQLMWHWKCSPLASIYIISTRANQSKRMLGVHYTVPCAGNDQTFFRVTSSLLSAWSTAEIETEVFFNSVLRLEVEISNEDVDEPLHNGIMALRNYKMRFRCIQKRQCNSWLHCQTPVQFPLTS